MTDAPPRLRDDLPRDALAEFSRRNHIRRLALFGSALRDDFRPDSDLDILVEFEPDARVGLRFFALQRELTELLGRAVDLNTPAFLSPYFRDQVMAEAEDIYVAP
jgi:predicted nucleotidyltransferase